MFPHYLLTYSDAHFLFLISLQSPYLLQIHVVTFHIFLPLFEFESFLFGQQLEIVLVLVFSNIYYHYYLTLLLLEITFLCHYIWYLLIPHLIFLFEFLAFWTSFLYFVLHDSKFFRDWGTGL